MNTNYFELKEIRKEKNKELINLSRFKGLQEECNLLKSEIKDITKKMNKQTSYRRVNILGVGRYSKNITIIKFTKKTKMKEIKKFLKLNNLKVGYTKIDTIPSDYDCTGQIHAIEIEIANNTIIITSYKDV